MELKKNNKTMKMQDSFKADLKALCKMLEEIQRMVF